MHFLEPVCDSSSYNPAVAVDSSNNWVCEKQLVISQCLYLEVPAHVASDLGLPFKQLLSGSVHSTSACTASLSYSVISWDSSCI